MPGGLGKNREFYAGKVDAGGVGAELLDALYDPQTSGGLFVSVPSRRAAAFSAALQRRRAWHVEAGEVVARGARAIELIG